MSLFYRIHALPSATKWPWRERRHTTAQTGAQSALSPVDAQARYLVWVLNYASARVGAGPDAEDVCAETFAAAFAQWHRCPRPAHSDSADDPVRAWLAGIARRKVADIHRRRARALPAATTDETDHAVSSTPGPEWSVLSTEATKVLQDAIASLPPDQAEALRLKYSDSLSLADIGKVLRCSPAAASQLLYRARASVRARAGSYFLPAQEDTTR